ALISFRLPLTAILSSPASAFTVLMLIRGNRNVVTGGKGNDIITLLGGSFNEVYAGDGNDTVIGSNNADFIAGDKGDDVLTGNGGNDVIEGGEGNDTLTGGSGNDIFVFGADAFGFTDTITDFVQGKDKLFIDGFSLGSATPNADGTYSFDNGTDVLTIDLGDITLTESDFITAL
ncbi:MAG: hypothetical protein AAFO83_14100, partial [Cyanobacteria bacterium J06607_13]